MAPPTGRRSDPHQVFVGRRPGGSRPSCPRRVVYPGRGTHDLPVIGGLRRYGRVTPGQTGHERPVLTACATGDHGVRTALSSVFNAAWTGPGGRRRGRSPAGPPGPDRTSVV